MDDVDGIIIRTLNGVGCEWDDVNSLSELSPEQAVEGVVRCLLQIQPDLQMSPNLPPSMSAKYRITTMIADTVKELGYQQELGYHTFLYSSHSDLRKVLMFLIDKLPKEPARAVEEPLKRSALLRREIENSIQAGLATPWVPHYCIPKKSNFEFQTCDLMSMPLSAKLAPGKKFASSQEMICTFLELNEMAPSGKNEVDEIGMDKERLNGLLLSAKEAVEHALDTKNVSPARRSKPHIKPRPKPVPRPRTGKVAMNGEAVDHIPVNEEVEIKSIEQKKQELKQSREDEISNMKISLQSVTEQAGSLRMKLETAEDEILNLKREIEEGTSVNSETEEALKVLKLTCDLLSSHEENLEKLEGLVATSKQRHHKLQEQWDSYRQPLDEEMKDLESKLSAQSSAEVQILNEMKRLRIEMEETRKDARVKDQFHQQLEAQVKKITKSVSRNVYTKRILEIVENIRKQHCELEKVLEDTKLLQKDINKLQGQLDRSFTLADELIFRDAKRDEGSKRAYKQLAALHEGCDQLILAIQDTGAISREIQQLQDQVDTEAQKNVASNLKRLSDDLQKMKEENSKLSKSLEEKSKKIQESS